MDIDLEKIIYDAKWIAKIPALSNHEGNKIEYISQHLDLLNIGKKIDKVGNVVVKKKGKNKDIVVIDAHIDTVYGKDIKHEITEKNGKLFGPSIADNSIAVASLIYAANYVIKNNIETNNSLLFTFTVGEESEGDLKGIKNIINNYKNIKEVVAIEGGWLNYIINRHLGGERFWITINCDGGHAWMDKDKPTAEKVYRDFIPKIEDYIDLKKNALHVGLIKGGTSTSSHMKELSFSVGLRSMNKSNLNYLMKKVKNSSKKLEKDYEKINCKIKIEDPFSSRPASTISKNYEGIKKILKIKKELGIDNIFKVASTNSNYPNSLGIPSFCIGTTIGDYLHDPEREYIEIEPVKKGTEMLIKYIMKC